MWHMLELWLIPCKPIYCWNLPFPLVIRKSPYQRLEIQYHPISKNQRNCQQFTIRQMSNQLCICQPRIWDPLLTPWNLLQIWQFHHKALNLGNGLYAFLNHTFPHQLYAQTQHANGIAFLSRKFQFQILYWQFVTNIYS
jgi:hypothetical protein